MEGRWVKSSEGRRRRRGLFVIDTCDLSCSRIHEVNLIASDACHRHEGLGVVVRNLFGGETLDAIACSWAMVEERPHGRAPLRNRRGRDPAPSPPAPSPRPSPRGRPPVPSRPSPPPPGGTNT